MTLSLWPRNPDPGLPHGEEPPGNRPTAVHLGAAVQAITRTDGRFTLTDAAGRAHAFDHVVFASPADATKAMLDARAGSTPARPTCAG